MRRWEQAILNLGHIEAGTKMNMEEDRKGEDDDAYGDAEDRIVLGG